MPRSRAKHLAGLTPGPDENAASLLTFLFLASFRLRQRNAVLSKLCSALAVPVLRAQHNQP